MILKTQPKTFVIALKDHPVSESQLADCLASAKRHGWGVEIFWGVNGNTINSTTWKSLGLFPRPDKPTMSKPGVQGCFLSHYSLWNKCIELNEPIIILEHDALIQEAWPGITLTTAVIKLHRYYKQKNIKYDSDTGVWSPSGHAYCISPTHAKILVNYVKKIGAFEVDRILGQQVINVEHLGKPSLVERQDSYSTTENL